MSASRWEAAELVATLDPTVVARMLAAHPATGRCWSCHCGAPCGSRTFAVAVQRAGTRRKA